MSNIRQIYIIGKVTLILILRFVPILSYYHEPSMLAISLPDGTGPGTLMGFSMAYLNKHLFISAPKHGNGIVFDYDILIGNYEKISLPYLDDGRSYWFGAVLNVGSEFLVTCAPRLWYQEYYHKTRGLCYGITNNTLHELKDILDDQVNYFSNSGLDTTGWSIDVDANDVILIGSPAVSLGGLVKFYENKKSLPWILKNITSYNFGYAIASGNFLSENEITYAISTTFGDFGEGMVFIVNKLYYELLRLPGNEVGGLYGAALCKVKLYGSTSSLLVGSPTFSDRFDRYDNGAVYVYAPSEGAKELTLKTIIKGQQDGGYFGFAIANLGDLDGDEQEEVAIGAPYEDDLRGAVYIYTGAGLLSGNTWLQRIQPQEYKSFGHSLVALNNCFDNGCNELAVGAPYNDKAFILKCISHITINLEAFFPNLQIRTNRTYFIFNVCVNVQYPKKHKINTSISIKVDINHPDASLEEKNGTFLFSIGSESLYCKNATVLTPIDGNYDELIAYKITASLNDVPSDVYSNSLALFSERSQTEIQGQVCAADCKGLKGCMPHLTATLQSNISEPFIMGSGNASFSMSVLNSGETAYSACVNVLVLGAHVLQHPSTCTRLDQAEHIMCKPSRPIVTDVWRIEEIQIDTDSLNSNDENITVHYIIYDHCNNHEEKREYERVFRLGYDTEGIMIKGISNPSDSVNFTSEEATKKQSLEHVYTIINNGTTHWVGVKCNILLEKSPYFNYSVSVIKNTMSSCAIKDDEAHVYAICEVGDLKPSTVVNVIVNIEIQPDALGDIIRTNNGQINTKLAVFLKEEQIKSVSTKLTLVSTSAPAWLIILALLLGLLIISIIIYILYKKKCFQRKNKKKLNNLKKSLYVKDRGSQRGCSSDSQ